MAKDPYKHNILKASPYHKKNTVIGRNVVILKEYLDNRELQLIYPKSRVVKKHEAHEVIITDEDAEPGDTVNSVAFLCFVEFITTGVILRGDEVRINGKRIGDLCGFDETHMPNHINIVIKGDELICGKDLELSLNSIMEFVKK